MLERTAVAVPWPEGIIYFLNVNPIVEIRCRVALIFPFCGRTLM